MPRDLDYAADILAAARLALSYVEGVPYQTLWTTRCARMPLLIIGEEAKRLSNEFKAAHPGIPWRQMAGMRDIVVHAYDHVDLDEVWRVATAEPTNLIAAVEPIVQAD